MKYLVVIPTINSQKTILDVVDSINELKKSINIDVLVVDYGSKDLTLQYLENNSVPHLQTKIKTTYENALYLGIKYAELKSYDYVIEYDDLGIVDNAEILRGISELSNNDILIGKRIIDRKSNDRRFSSKILAKIAKIKTGQNLSDLTMRLKFFKVQSCKRYLNDRNWYPTPDAIVRMIIDGLKCKEFNTNLKLNYNNDYFNKYFGTKKIRFKLTFQWIISILIMSPFKEMQKGEQNE